jgi:hypothetical protein
VIAKAADARRRLQENALQIRLQCVAVEMMPPAEAAVRADAPASIAASNARPRDLSWWPGPDGRAGVQCRLRVAAASRVQAPTVSEDARRCCHRDTTEPLRLTGTGQAQLCIRPAYTRSKKTCWRSRPPSIVTFQRAAGPCHSLPAKVSARRPPTLDEPSSLEKGITDASRERLRPHNPRSPSRRFSVLHCPALHCTVALYHLRCGLFC